MIFCLELVLELESRVPIGGVIVTLLTTKSMTITSVPRACGIKCPDCGSRATMSDETRADTVCTDCGSVLESGRLDSEVEFVDSGRGGKTVAGRFVPAGEKGGGGGCQGLGLGQEGGEVTLRKARKKIQALAQHLRLPLDRIDLAFQYYQQALARGLTRVRKNTRVVAACVYMACRTGETEHMLLDLGSVLQEDVYALGRMVTFLARQLGVRLPPVNDILYVYRFANELNLDNQTFEVIKTGLRLVTRMKADWLHMGRRPAGVCGAALLLAARLHGFSRTVVEVAGVVKVHQETLRKRLREFGETPAAGLTLEEFMGPALLELEEQDPPSFTAARRKEEELEEEQEPDEYLLELNRKIDEGLEKRRQKLEVVEGVMEME